MGVLISSIILDFWCIAFNYNILVAIVATPIILIIAVMLVHLILFLKIKIERIL